MVRFVDELIDWMYIVIGIAAFFTTLFPILYASSPWYKSALGRIFMVQSIALAMAVDATLLTRVWVPTHPVGVFLMDASIFTLIAITSASLTYQMWTLNHPKNGDNDESDE